MQNVLFVQYNEGVVVICKNGETQEVGGRFNKSSSPDKREGLGNVQISGSINGGKQIRADKADCSRQSPSRATIDYGETPVGKILERLEFIEGAYISYVKSHQERLEVRLSESKEKEQEFREAVKEVKEEIYNLISSQQQETEIEDNE
ncbi:hypothetical protein CAL7716_023920 [Calothrix sp. PCC 7716]|nr:hypothetical protein CAL7716_023920 [Calothrix sp. PCC 7716]